SPENLRLPLISTSELRTFFDELGVVFIGPFGFGDRGANGWSNPDSHPATLLRAICMERFRCRGTFPRNFQHRAAAVPNRFNSGRICARDEKGYSQSPLTTDEHSLEIRSIARSELV